MRQRSTVIARRTDDVQPTAILGAMGVITFLMVTWLGLVL